MTAHRHGWLTAALLALFALAEPAGAALPANHSLGKFRALPSGHINSQYRSGTNPVVSDTTAPTVPLRIAVVDNANGTGTLTWLAASDPSVSGVVTGVTSYRVRLGGSDVATVSAPSANAQPALGAMRIGEADGESSSQSGADWTLTYGGTGLASTADGIYGRLTPVVGDFVAALKVTSFTPASGTTGSIGIAARASDSAPGAVAAYGRWRDSDNRCNLRYRLVTDGAAANGTLSTVAYDALPVWILVTRVGDVVAHYCSADGITFTQTSLSTVPLGATAYVGPFITGGAAGVVATGVAAQFGLHQAGDVSYLYTGAGGSFTVSSYDGITRSAESAAVTLTPTGGAPAQSEAPRHFVVAREASTAATIEWKAPLAGTAPTSYRVYVATTENGSYSQAYEGMPTPDDGIYSTTISSGIPTDAERWFKVAGVAAGVEGTRSEARRLSIGVVSRYLDTVDLWRDAATAPSAGPPFQVSTTSVDSFASDDYVPTPAINGGDLGMRLVKTRVFGGHWAFRAQLTQHSYGSNSPSDSVASSATYPTGTVWRVKGDASTEKAHRNEYAFIGGTEATDADVGEDHWLGFAVYLPGDNDPLGDAPTRARSSIPGNWSDGPQLHPTNIPDNPSTPENEKQSFSPELSLYHGTGGYAGYGSSNAYRTQHPAGAPVVRFQRGGIGPLGAVSAATTGASVTHAIAKTQDGQTLYVEWDAVAGATTYRVEAAWRPEGPWAEVTTSSADNITVDLANRRVIATGLANSSMMTTGTKSTSRYIRVTPIVGGVAGVTSLICPAPQWHWGWSGADFSIDARPDYGRWVRWVVHFRRSATATGALEIWKDDVKVEEQLGIQQGVNTALPAYWKIGIYAGHVGGVTESTPAIGMDWPWRRVLYFDELRMQTRSGGTSGATDITDSAYQAVRPRGP